jgi:hypothetical protein
VKDPELLDSIQKRLTKEEVEEMIEDKVDKDELTRAIEDLTKTYVGTTIKRLLH